MDHNNLCPGCFTDSSGQNPCPTCGYAPDNNPGAGLYLTPGTLLFGKYLVGRVLGQGGFGITYLGWDTNLDIRIAIKEFFPQGLVSRVPGENSVISYTGEIKDQFSFGVESFLRESKTLARFEHHPNIVSVRDFFKENNTAYMVMSFIEGITLLEHLNCSGGRIPVEQAVQIIMPVLDALREVHRAGIMHRDISPDNIFIDREGRIVLIDFGAARQEMREKSKSLSVILKAGYAPEEQYRSRGKQGPWTDIYAVAATLYRAITGETPLEAIDRMDEDDLLSPSQFGVEIDPGLERALLKALAVKAGERFQSVGEFQAELSQEAIQPEQSQSKSAVDSSTGEQDQHFRPEPKHGKNIEKEILLSRLEADLGAERSIIIDLDSICLECNGTGLKNGNVCFQCKGKGKQQKQKTLSVKIPAKVKEGARIRLEGQGGKGSNGGADGDLFLKVKLETYEKEKASHSRYSQQAAREKAKGIGKDKVRLWQERRAASDSSKAKQQQPPDAKQEARFIKYAIAAVACVFLLIGVISLIGVEVEFVGFDKSGMEEAAKGAVDVNDEGAGSDGAVPEEGNEETGQTTGSAAKDALDADYYIDYANGTIPLGDLPIGARVVDPGWVWEFRTALAYVYNTGDKTKPVTWILVAKDHYDGHGPHVTIFTEERIGHFAFDNSHDRGSLRGSNNWGDSGIPNATFGLRPWLNSTGIHSGEGFYRAFSESFKQAVLTTTVPNKEWRNGSEYSTQDKVFIPSTTELGDIEHERTYQIGKVYPYFQGAGDAKREVRGYYWTRSPVLLESDRVRGVRSSGAFYDGYERVYLSSVGVRPALNLKSDTLVSEVKN